MDQFILNEFGITHEEYMTEHIAKVFVIRKWNQVERFVFSNPILNKFGRTVEENIAKVFVVRKLNNFEVCGKGLDYMIAVTIE